MGRKAEKKTVDRRGRRGSRGREEEKMGGEKKGEKRRREGKEGRGGHQLTLQAISVLL